MIRRSICEFLRSSYGEAAWQAMLQEASLRESDLLNLDARPREARRLITAAARNLRVSPAELIEDLGAWLVRLDPIRRLLRFSGSTFEDFILSLEELPGRARMVMPGLTPIELQVTPGGPGRYTIHTRHLPPGWIMAMSGAIRSMADDYGVLAIISVTGSELTLWIASTQHGTKSAFSLISMSTDGTKV